MSGDTGRGATRKATSFGAHLAAAEDRPPGIAKDRNSSFETPTTASPVISGVAFGGYARKRFGRILSSLESQHGLTSIENHPEYLEEALREALIWWELSSVTTLIRCRGKCFNHYFIKAAFRV